MINQYPTRRVRAFGIVLLALGVGLFRARSESISSSVSIEGTWFGHLSLPGSELRLVFHVTKSGANWAAIMDSPDQRAFGIRMDRVDLIDGTVTLAVDQIHGQYSGHLSVKGTQLTGTWIQGPMALPLALNRTPPIPFGKPWPILEPTIKDLVYAEKSPAEKLDLYLPAKGGEPAPLVIWIHGGGFTVGDKRSMSRRDFGPPPRPRGLTESLRFKFLMSRHSSPRVTPSSA